jgi:hypothetical protein
MSQPSHRRLLSSAVALAAFLTTACADPATSPAERSGLAGSATSLSKGGGGGGGGGGGTVTPPATPPFNLPTTAPAPGVLLRESFGLAAGFRPQGDKGAMRDVGIHTSIAGYWLEYLGSKDTQWLTQTTGQSWKFAGCSDDPYELASPLQTPSNGCVASDWFDAVTSYPTALVPFAAPASGYELSMDGYPAPIANAYVAIGFTSSTLVASNLTTAGSLWLRVRNLGSGPLSYELRTGSLATGALLASGTAGFPGWNRMSIRYAPATGTATLSIDGTVVGSYAAPISSPRYVAFEGVGILDNLVVRE